MDYREVIKELTAQHTRILNPMATKEILQAMGQRSLAEEWNSHGAAIKFPPEFPRPFELAKAKEEARRAERWVVPCALYLVEIHHDPHSKEERKKFLRASEALPALATRYQEVHWPILRDELEFSDELTLQAMAFGHHLDVWFMETPLQGYVGREAYRLAYDGMVLVRPVSKKHESMKFRLFTRRC